MALVQKSISNMNITPKEVMEATISQKASKQFLMRFIPCTSAFILYQRVEFPESDFKSAKYVNYDYKMFNKDIKNETLIRIRMWFTGVLDALDKNCLREIYLVLCDVNNHDHIYEVYKYQFKYLGGDMVQFDVKSTQGQLNTSTIEFLAAIKSLEAFEKFKESDVFIQMMLTYYEDALPVDYTPPYFSQNEKESDKIMEAVHNAKAEYLRLGFLRTGYHTIKCRAKGEIFALNCSTSLDASGTEETNKEAEQENENREREKDTEREEETSFGNCAVVDTSDKISIGSSLEINENNKEATIQCICRISVHFKCIDLVACSSCMAFQHSVCLGYLFKEDVPSDYICCLCKNSGVLELTPTFLNESILKSIYRLSTAVAYFTNKVPVEVLDKVTREVREFITKKLTKNGVLIQKNKRTVVNKEFLEEEHLKLVFSKSFKKRVPDSMALDEISQPTKKFK